MIKSLRNFLIWWLVLHLKLRQKKSQEKVLFFAFFYRGGRKAFSINFFLRFTSEYEKNTQKNIPLQRSKLKFSPFELYNFFSEARHSAKLQMRIQTMSGVSVNMLKKNWKGELLWPSELIS